MKLTIDVVAAGVVVDAIAVAHVEPVVCAVSPDPVLHEPWESLRKARVEPAGVNLLGNSLNDVGTTIGSITGGPIRMVSIEPAKNARANQKVVDQRVDRDHASPYFGPLSHVLRCGK